MKTVKTYIAAIKMAGDIDHAKRLLRDECYNRGLCVTVESTTFIYTGGEEMGFVVTCINYPRFESTPEEVYGRAVEIATKLVPALNQKTAIVIASDMTTWIAIDPPGARS